MISTSKTDKSIGQQVLSQVQFNDYVLIKNKEGYMKIVVQDTGVSLLQQTQNLNWIDISPICKESSDWNSIVSQISQNQNELMEHQRKLIQQSHELKTSQNVIASLQDQLVSSKQSIDQLQLQLRILSANVTDIKNALQGQFPSDQQEKPELEESYESPNLTKQTSIDTLTMDHVKKSTKTEEEQTFSNILQVQISDNIQVQVIDTENQNSVVSNQLVEEQKVVDIVIIKDQKDQIVVDSPLLQQVEDQLNNLPIMINKTFQLKTTNSEFVQLQTKEQFTWEKVPKTLSCRHIRQFFDLQVVNVQEDGTLTVQYSDKLKNKQTVFVIQAI